MPLLPILRFLLGWNSTPVPVNTTPVQKWVSKPIKFSFIPPPTIPPQSVLAPGSVTIAPTALTANTFGSPQAAASNAAALVTRLSDLYDTAAYLQQAIQSLVKQLGVQFDLSANPDLGRALAQIYNTSTPPSSMDMSMYITLLETDMSFLQFDLLNPASSAVQIQPLQRANVGIATKAFENALISTGVYNQTLPVLLRSLATDQVVFGALTAALMTYPILSVPQLTPAQQASTQAPVDSSTRALNSSAVDVSDALNDTLNTALDQWQSSYAGIYNVVASPDPTETALPSVVATLSSQPSSDLNRLSSMLSNLVSFQNTPAVQQAHDSIDNQVVPRLLSDIGNHGANLDYVNQVAVTPSSNFGGSLGSLMSTLAAINPGSILGVGLTGAVATASGGPNPTPPTSAQVATLAGLAEGLQILGANIMWSQSESMRQSAVIQQSIQRLTLRKVSNQGDQTELLTSLKSLSSSIGIIQSLLQSGANTPVSSGNTTSLNTGVSTPSVGLQSFGTLVNSLQSQSGSSYSIDGNTLIITPPAIPTAPANVQATLQAGGVNQITTQALQVPVNLGV